MFCTNCGAEVEPGQRFCNKCGAPVDPGAVNINVQQTMTEGQGISGFQTPPEGQNIPNFQPAQAGQYVQAPSRELPKSWPIILIACIAVLIMIAGFVGAFFGIRYLKDLAEKPVEDGFWLDGDDYGAVDPDIDFDMDEFNAGLDDLEDKLGDIDPYLGSQFADEFDLDEYLNEEYDYHEYEFVEAYGFSDYMYLYGKDVIDDDTVIFNGKTIGGFCDFVDKEILGGDDKIDRDLLYELMEVHLVDPSFLTKENTANFEQSMMYCLLFTNEFSNLDVDLYSCSYGFDEPTRYYYDVEVNGEFDQWEVDYSHKEVFFNYGGTQYKSVGDFSMFDEKSMTGWIYAVDHYFGIE